MLSELANQARKHADNLQADLRNTSSRQEHMRLTRLAIEAAAVASGLEQLLAQESAGGETVE